MSNGFFFRNTSYSGVGGGYNWSVSQEPKQGSFGRYSSITPKDSTASTGFVADSTLLEDSMSFGDGTVFSQNVRGRSVATNGRRGRISPAPSRNFNPHADSSPVKDGLIINPEWCTLEREFPKAKAHAAVDNNHNTYRVSNCSSSDDEIILQEHQVVHLDADTDMPLQAMRRRQPVKQEGAGKSAFQRYQEPVVGDVSVPLSRSIIPLPGCRQYLPIDKFKEFGEDCFTHEKPPFGQKDLHTDTDEWRPKPTVNSNYGKPFTLSTEPVCSGNNVVPKLTCVGTQTTNEFTDGFSQFSATVTNDLKEHLPAGALITSSVLPVIGPEKDSDYSDIFVTARGNNTHDIREIRVIHEYRNAPSSTLALPLVSSSTSSSNNDNVVLKEHFDEITQAFKDILLIVENFGERLRYFTERR